ncbi:hypothetical protein TNCV_4835271 [Trichonephila clavipes]|nr:hypothetical protein TNCV_4835271 [Trichonephila clavipes]
MFNLFQCCHLAPVLGQDDDLVRKNSGLCIRKKRLTACLTSAFPKQDCSSKPGTDKNHLVRDQDCMVDGVGAPYQELQHGFALMSPCGSALPSNNRTADLRNPDNFFHLLDRGPPIPGVANFYGSTCPSF